MSIRAFVTKRRLVAVLLLAGLVGVLGWWALRPDPLCNLTAYTTESRDTLLAPDPFGENVASFAYLDQGWSPSDSIDFYTRSQGSRLLPYRWFLALEQPENQTLFRDADHIARLRYLPQKPNPCNPDGLPVGFARDPKHPGESEDFVGFTCAACHTTQIHYNKVAYRIDGGPGMGDAETLLEELARALKTTAEDPAKFDRFAGRVLSTWAGAAERDALKAKLADTARARRDYNALNAAPHPSGFARLDAFGRILNAVLVSDLGVHDESQKKAPDAPVSYPFLWDTPYHDYVQWNGFVKNTILGSEALGGLARNVGEVLGVFGEVHIPPRDDPTAVAGYKSSARIANMLHLEKLLRKLQSPKWPEAFPPINEDLSTPGAAKFEIYCVRCHAPIGDRTDLERKVEAVKTPLGEIGTDPRMAENFAGRRGKTGPLEDRRRLFLVGERFGHEAPAEEILLHTIVGVIEKAALTPHKPVHVLELGIRPIELVQEKRDLHVYKARPLNGIWATAPYLHNGSVPNLWQLLLPAKERDREFHVGRREFDPKLVGFQTAPFDGGFLLRTHDDQGRPIPGNSNAGHEYGTGKAIDAGGDGLPKLDDDERWQLIEYMKSL